MEYRVIPRVVVALISLLILSIISAVIVFVMAYRTITTDDRIWISELPAQIRIEFSRDRYQAIQLGSFGVEGKAEGFFFEDKNEILLMPIREMGFMKEFAKVLKKSSDIYHRHLIAEDNNKYVIIFTSKRDLDKEYPVVKNLP